MGIELLRAYFSGKKKKHLLKIAKGLRKSYVEADIQDSAEYFSGNVYSFQSEELEPVLIFDAFGADWCYLYGMAFKKERDIQKSIAQLLYAIKEEIREKKINESLVDRRIIIDREGHQLIMCSNSYCEEEERRMMSDLIFKNHFLSKFSNNEKITCYNTYTNRFRLRQIAA